jgi:hypothetical protein
MIQLRTGESINFLDNAIDAQWNLLKMACDTQNIELAYGVIMEIKSITAMNEAIKES